MLVEYPGFVLNALYVARILLLMVSAITIEGSNEHGSNWFYGRIDLSDFTEPIADTAFAALRLVTPVTLDLSCAARYSLLIIVRDCTSLVKKVFIWFNRIPSIDFVDGRQLFLIGCHDPDPKMSATRILFVKSNRCLLNSGLVHCSNYRIKWSTW